ncbi:MAG: hypothetical protein K1000chlam3_01256 [Chlamydiae bacterium]|nr:hypothetical protein [Chlamydiota bacterium]
MLNPLLNDQVNLTTIKDCDLPEIESLRQVDQNLRNLVSDNSLWREKADEIGCPIKVGEPPGSVREQVIKYVTDLRQKVNELFLDKLYVPFPKEIPTIDDIKDFVKAIATQDLLPLKEKFFGTEDLTSNFSLKQKIGHNILKNQSILAKKISMSTRIIGGAIIGAVAASSLLYLTPEEIAALAHAAIANCEMEEKCSSVEIASLGVAEKTAEMIRNEFEVTKDFVLVMSGSIMLSTFGIIIENKISRIEGIKGHILQFGKSLTFGASILALIFLGPNLLRGVAARAEIAGALGGAIALATSRGIFSTTEGIQTRIRSIGRHFFN